MLFGGAVWHDSRSGFVGTKLLRWPLASKQVEQTIQPSDDAQRAALYDLGAAAKKATELLKDSCPAQTPLTPTGRLAAVKTRLAAMLEAVKPIGRPWKSSMAH